MRVCCAAAAAVLCAISTNVSAQTVHVNINEVLTRMREQSPAVRAARARIDEVRGRIAGARVRLRDNPTLEAFTGPRRTISGADLIDIDLSVAQTFETGGQRSARMAGAAAAVAAEESTAQEVVRRELERAALAFYRSVYAQERVRLLADVERTAEQVVRLATRRYEAGDIAVLDVNLGKTALTRARSARMAAEADRIVAAGDLARLLAMPADQELVADGMLTGSRSADLTSLIAAIESRPDFQALKSAATEAEADLRLARGLRRPDVGVGVRASRDGGDHLILGGVTLTLPAFNSGQELLATASARATRIGIELATARAAAAAEVRTLYDAQVIREAAAAAYEHEALPSAAENEQLAERSFEVGQLTLADLLVVRRELTETRLEYLARLVESVETAVRRDAAAGVLR